MIKRKKVLLLGISFVCFMTLFGCISPKQAAEEVTQSFFDALIQGDYETAKTYSTGTITNFIDGVVSGQEYIDSIFEEKDLHPEGYAKLSQLRNNLGIGRFESFEITGSEKISDEQVDVDVTVSTKEEDELFTIDSKYELKTYRFHIVKQEEGWIVQSCTPALSAYNGRIETFIQDLYLERDNPRLEEIVTHFFTSASNKNPEETFSYISKEAKESFLELFYLEELNKGQKLTKESKKVKEQFIGTWLNVLFEDFSITNTKRINEDEYQMEVEVSGLAASDLELIKEKLYGNKEKWEKDNEELIEKMKEEYSKKEVTDKIYIEYINALSKEVEALEKEDKKAKVIFEIKKNEEDFLITEICLVIQ